MCSTGGGSIPSWRSGGEALLLIFLKQEHSRLISETHKPLYSVERATKNDNFSLLCAQFLFVSAWCAKKAGGGADNNDPENLSLKQILKFSLQLHLVELSLGFFLLIHVHIDVFV